MAISSGRDQTDQHDLLRMKKLETELQRLVAAVDARLSEPKPHHQIPAPRHQLPAKTRQDMAGLFALEGFDKRHLAAVAGLAALLFTAGWAGSSLFYSSRLQHQVESELRPYASELAGTVATIQTDLAPRMAIADELKAEIDQARRDVLAGDEELSVTITEAQNQLLGIRDQAIDDIERRLSDQTDDLSLMLEASRKRAAELDQGLDDIAQALAAFDRQLPILTEDFSEVVAGLQEGRAWLDKASNQMAALDGETPAVLETIGEHRVALDEGTETLAILQTQLEALKTQTTRSSEQLEQVLAEGRGRIADWEGVDREIANRKENIMRNLDQYADSLNARVREFIEALNVETTFTGG